ncbi:MAG: NADH-quinone oxidoreductase subunit NuoE [Desulfomonile tiedjei]|nr:NADH-quinone oxidoreductase subunit NuoE [Desulfomonile tiedjei]
MLSEEIKREIESYIREHCPTPRGASIEALMVLQRHRGWLSDESIRELAAYLEMSPDELDGVATFYNHLFRKPVGRHVIWICDSVSCWIMGYEGLLEHMQGRLGINPGETTPDGRFTLLPIQCLGACHHAPALMIDDDLHEDLTPQKFDEILERYE